MSPFNLTVGNSMPFLTNSVNDDRPLCYCSMILSVVNCSVKMSVHERIDIEPMKTSESTGLEQSIGGERMPRVTTSGSLYILISSNGSSKLE